MGRLRAQKWLNYAVILFFVFGLKMERLQGVELTIVNSAVAKGAVCLDGSPPAYELEKGSGDGVNNWLIHLQGGGWCHTVEDCVYRKTMDNGLGSSKLMPLMGFYGILGNQQEQNPNFYNWNRVIMRYCDGSSFTGDVEEVDPTTNLHFRGARIFNAITEELLSLGMKDAQNAILTGCSAGGLATILNCDRFRGFLPSNTRVKCVADAGYFPHVKDVSGGYHFEEYNEKVVTLHGSAKYLPSGCTSAMKPGLCFYAQFAMPYIKTPIFVLNSAYDTWPVSYILTSNEADPQGTYTKCKTDLTQCSTRQIQRLQEYRTDFIGAVRSGSNSSSKGMFINTCYTHCQSDNQQAWLGSPTWKVDDKSISEVVDDWFYDKHKVQMIDNEHVIPRYC